jgi:FkbM family methyltransferase
MTLITESYRREQAALHAKGNYGVTGAQFGPLVRALLGATQARSLLDYGCGSKRSLLTTLKLPQGVEYEGYDPAVPDFAANPLPAELVSCIDVLEHIEPNLLGDVLAHLASLCDPYGFFTVHTGPAAKVLSDGRNAHLIQQPREWWLQRLRDHFDVLVQEDIAGGFCVLVRSLDAKDEAPLPDIARLIREHNKARAAALETAAEAGSRAPERPAKSSSGIEHNGVKMLFTTPNEATTWRVKTFYEKEPDTIAWLESIPKDAVLLDVGANVGMYSVFAAKVRNAKVYAFEPESQNYALLNANIAANALSGQVMAYPMALSDGIAVDRLYLSGFAPGSSCHSFGEEVGFDLKPRHAAFQQGCISISVDELVARGAMPVPAYIKIDVDGFEHKVIQGAAATLANPAVLSVIVELNTHLKEHVDAIHMLEGLGFRYDEQQAKGALRKSGAFEGVGEFIFSRTLSSAGHVDFKQGSRLTLPRKARGRQVLAHVLERVARTPVIQEPFPYLVVDDVFPQDYYAEMLAHFPTHDSLRPLGESGRVPKGTYEERLTVLFTDEEFARMTHAQQEFWRDFADWMYTDQFAAAFVTKFASALEPRLANILAADEMLKMKGDALLVNDQTRYAIGPHTDAPHRLVSFLFYLPRDASMRELGTSVYRHKDTSFVCWGGPHYPFDDFIKVDTVEFLPNRLMAFPKTERSFHGVERIERADVNRPLLINNVRVLNTKTH